MIKHPASTNSNLRPEAHTFHEFYDSKLGLEWTVVRTTCSGMRLNKCLEECSTTQQTHPTNAKPRTSEPRDGPAAEARLSHWNSSQDQSIDVDVATATAVSVCSYVCVIIFCCIYTGDHSPSSPTYGTPRSSTPRTPTPASSPASMFWRM